MTQSPLGPSDSELNDGGQRWNRRVLYDGVLWVPQEDADRATSEVAGLVAQHHGEVQAALDEADEALELARAELIDAGLTATVTFGAVHRALARTRAVSEAGS